MVSETINGRTTGVQYGVHTFNRLLSSDFTLKITPKDAETIRQEIRRLKVLRETSTQQRLKQYLLQPLSLGQLDAQVEFSHFSVSTCLTIVA